MEIVLQLKKDVRNWANMPKSPGSPGRVDFSENRPSREPWLEKRQRAPGKFSHEGRGVCPGNPGMAPDSDRRRDRFREQYIGLLSGHKNQIRICQAGVC